MSRVRHTFACAECGNDFNSVRSDAKYCSRKCLARVSARRAYSKLSEAERSNIYIQRKEYLTQYGDNQKLLRARKCRWCNYSFLPCETGRVFYCSRECYKKSRHYKANVSKDGLESKKRSRLTGISECLPRYIKKLMRQTGYDTSNTKVVNVKSKLLKLKRKSNEIKRKHYA